MYMSEIQQQIKEQQEEQLILTVNKSIGYDVDKQELIKALQYDREQYTKGYRDCKSDMLDKIKQARQELDKLPVYGAKFTDDFRIHLDREEVFAIIDKLIESEG
jgi:hypothetical protein